MRNIVVTTPKHMTKTAAAEAQKCIEAGGGLYFRRFKLRPAGLCVGSRIYYVERDYIRGFGVISEIRTGDMVCDITGQNWGLGYYAIMPAESWTWIEPIPMKGFQGWRYFDDPTQSVGGWLDSMPKL